MKKLKRKIILINKFISLGEELNDVVNCFDGTVMEKMPIKHFWKGFENFKERPVCKEPVALLKLKVRSSILEQCFVK